MVCCLSVVIRNVSALSSPVAIDYGCAGASPVAYGLIAREVER